MENITMSQILYVGLGIIFAMGGLWFLCVIQAVRIDIRADEDYINRLSS